ncbi:MAG: RES family NAD+ phosphorylase [Silvibacterium sp.]|nr:RES family NAD+ phosphorylase [Silvibacterium sp.]
MILWRVSNYASLDGSGGLYVSGRWHTRGHAVVYCAENPATALLETLVHLEIDAEDRPERFQVLRIEGPDTISRERIEPGRLPDGWQSDLTVTQRVGVDWLASGRSFLLEVPSVLAPETWNVLVNPRHREAVLLKISAVYEHGWDKRLL